MSGKLPIDRVREHAQAPRILEEEKKRYAEKQAKLRKQPQPSPQQPDHESDEEGRSKERDDS